MVTRILDILDILTLLSSRRAALSFWIAGIMLEQRALGAAIANESSE